MPLVIVVAAIVLGAGLLVYSQTGAYTGDEGFHLLAAQLIDKGKRPYLDFAFPQTPLNAYWNAFWMRLFGQTWRVPHFTSSLMVTAATILAARFVWRRFPGSPKWRTAAALAVLILVATNVVVVVYGPLAQAYGMGLLLLLAAFRLAFPAIHRASPLAALGVGLCAGGAAAASLLTAAAAPVYLIWTLYYNKAGRRWIKGAAFSLGAAIPFIPVLRLWSESARPVIFNLFEYHISYRALYWPETTQHDLEIVTSWIDSGQALLLLLLSLAGLLFIRFRSAWDPDSRRDFYFCGWLALALSLESCFAHPTFSRYFVFVVPFVAILAAPALYMLSERLYRPEAPYAAVVVLALLFALGLGKTLYQRAIDYRTWATYDQLVKKVKEVTPPQATLFADEQFYFLLQRTPPSGLEFSYTHRLKLAPALSAQLHIVTNDQLGQMAAQGKFATAATCDDEAVDNMHLDDLYIHKFENNDCYVYWGLVKKK